MNEVYARHFTRALPCPLDVRGLGAAGGCVDRDRVHRRARLGPLVSNSKLEVFLILLPIFIGSLTLHELAHGWVAYRSATRRRSCSARLSLNPIVHLEPARQPDVRRELLGGGFLFGWAKPVPVDPRNLRRGPQRGMAIVGIAGPITNFLLAIVFGALLAHTSYTGTAQQVIVYAHVRQHRARGLQPAADPAARRIAHRRRGFMDRQTYAAWSSLDQYGMVILLVLFFVFQGPFTTLLQNATTDVSTVISDIVGGQPFRL